MKNFKHIITVILLTIFTSCTYDDLNPSDEQAKLKEVFKEIVRMSSNISYYDNHSDNTAYTFYAKNFYKDLDTKFQIFESVEDLPETILYQMNYNDLNLQSEASEEMSLMTKFKLELHSLTNRFFVGDSEELKVELNKFGDEVYYSNLDIVSKAKMANLINLSFTAFVAIEEVALEEEIIQSDSRNIELHLNSSSGDCNYDWNGVIDSTLQGLIFGAIGGAILGGMAGVGAGFGLLSALTGPLGALAGANLGAMAGGVEEFARSATWAFIKNLICKAQESTQQN